MKYILTTKLRFAILTTMKEILIDGRYGKEKN